MVPTWCVAIVCSTIASPLLKPSFCVDAIGNAEMGVVANASEALRWYTCAANGHNGNQTSASKCAGDAYAIYILAHSYLFGTLGQKQDIKLAIKWLEHFEVKTPPNLSDDILADIEYCHGRCYSLLHKYHVMREYYERAGTRDCIKTIEYYERAAKRHCIKAIGYYERAAKRDCIKAIAALAGAHYCKQSINVLFATLLMRLSLSLNLTI